MRGSHPLGQNDSLSFYRAGINHPYGCLKKNLHHVSACDVDIDTGDIIVPADWSESSDPWNNMNSLLNNSKKIQQSKLKKWKCPDRWISPSGCGDFIADPRIWGCPQSLSLMGNHSHRMQTRSHAPHAPQYHVHFEYPIWYDSFDTVDTVTPPSTGRHRESWPEWGEYLYCPPQRWLHSAEHGGIVVLYNPCLDKEGMTKLRFLLSDVNNSYERFRYILTPFHKLRTRIALVSWGVAMLTDTLNQVDIQNFVRENYRNAWEDKEENGNYNYLKVGY